MKTTPGGLVRLSPFVAAVLALTVAGCDGPAYGGAPTSNAPPFAGGAARAPAPAASTPPSPTPAADGTFALTLYWSFARHVHGQTQLVGYDPSPGPGGITSSACVQSGVDTVVVYDAAGAPLDGTGHGVPCVYEGVQGATFFGFAPGTYDLTVTGYRNGVALYETPVRADVTASGQDAYDVSVPGIPDDLDVYALFLDSTGVEAWTTCATAVVDTLQYQLIDSAGTVVETGAIACLDPAGISFRNASGAGVDRGSYTISMQALDRGVQAFDATPPGCAAQAFEHLGADTLAQAWQVKLYVAGTACR